MALTVGQLVGYIELDTRGLDRGIAAAQRSMGQLAQDITRVTERASEQAGQALADGVQDGAQRAAAGAQGSLAGVAQAAGRAGDQASQALADGMADGGREGGRAASQGAEAGLAGVAQAADAAAGEASSELRSGLADGAGEGADAAVQAARARFAEISDAARRAAGEAGDAMEGPLADGARDAGEEAGDQVAAGLEAKEAVIAAVAVAAGAAFVAGFGNALEQGNATGLLQAQLGTSDAVAAQHGKTAGELYASGLVENIEGAADVIRGIAQQGLLPPEATQGQIETMGKKVATAASVMGEDVSKVSRAVGTMLKAGIADSADEAIDVLVAGTQRGANAAEDLLDTFAEYPTQFRDLGLSAEEAMGLMQQGLQGGARDADTVADGLKEFAIRAKDMSETSVEGFEAIGLSASEMAAIFAKGGPAARDALQTVISGLNAMEDPVARNTAGVNLFGTKFEDLQQAFYALNPDTAVAALGDIEGATDAATNALSETAGARIERFKRALEMGITNFIGEKVLPPLIKLGEIAKAMWDALPSGAQDTLSTFGTLAVVAAVAGVAIGGLVKAAGMARASLAGLAGQAGATGVAMRGLTASLGIVGLATAAVTTVMGIFGKESKKARMDGTQFAESLKQDAGKIGEFTREQARAALETKGLGKTAAAAGIDMGLMVDAVLGVPGAMDQVNAKFAAYNKTMNDSKLVSMGFTGSMQEIQGALQQGQEEYNRTAQAQAVTSEAVDDGTKSIEDQEKALDALSSAFDAIRGQFLDVQEAQSGLEASVDDLTESFKENGRELDLGTEKGRNNDAALRDMVESSYDLAEATLRSTGSQERANDVLAIQRQRFNDVLIQMGFTKEQAANLTAEYFRIPTNVGTQVDAKTGGAIANIAALKAELASIPAHRSVGIEITETTNKITRTFGSIWADGGINFPGRVRHFADGAHVAQIARGGEMRVWAEPETQGEAYIPLAQSKRQRSTEILATVAKDFGYQLVPAGARSYADGAAGTGGGAAAAGPQNIRLELAFSNRELVRLIRDEVATRGGNVQVVLGQ